MNNNIIELQLRNKKKIFHCKNKDNYGHYFSLLEVKGKKYFFYTGDNNLKLSISEDFSFSEGKTIISCNACTFSIFYDNKFYLIIGHHMDVKDDKNILYPDLVWPKNKKYKAGNINIFRKDRKNGLYLMSSEDGFNWNYVIEKPIFHCFLKSNTCPLGSCNYDTHPCIIKHGDVYYYYSRLNTKLDERLVFLMKSKDLINWEGPQRVNIENQECSQNPNYYLLCVFIKDDIFYAFTPYFEACGTVSRKSKNGKTLLIKSIDGLNWFIIGKCLEHKGRYQHRISDVFLKDNIIKIFVRENKDSLNQYIVSHDIDLLPNM